MSEPKRPIPLQDFLDGLAIEEEVERLAGVPRAHVEAATMTEVIDPARGRVAVQRVLARHGMKGDPVDGEAASNSNVVRLAAKAPSDRARGGMWMALAAAAAVVVAIGAISAITKRDAIEAWLSPAPTATSTSSSPPPTPPPDPGKERAARLREQAYVDVKKGYYGEALDALDAAKALDAAGDDDPAVNAARSQIAAGSADHGSKAKPSLGPGERPLQRTH